MADLIQIKWQSTVFRDELVRLDPALIQDVELNVAHDNFYVGTITLPAGVADYALHGIHNAFFAQVVQDDNFAEIEVKIGDVANSPIVSTVFSFSSNTPAVIYLSNPTANAIKLRYAVASN